MSKITLLAAVSALICALTSGMNLLFKPKELNENFLVTNSLQFLSRFSQSIVHGPQNCWWL